MREVWLHSLGELCLAPPPQISYLLLSVLFNWWLKCANLPQR